MYAKIFTQIFDSSIAENYELRHFFEDMLKLADKNGVVDMTPEAISRRINLGLGKVVEFLGELGKPDSSSRSKAYEGKRIIPLDKDRPWGWIVVNYGIYRGIRNEEDRREQNREAQMRHREKMAAMAKNRKVGRPPSQKEYLRKLERDGVAAADEEFDRGQNGEGGDVRTM